MNKSVIIAAVLGLAILPMSSGQVHAQAAVAQPATAKAEPVREVYPRDLMTFRERFDMWRAMRAAKTPEEKFELWAAKYAELEKRAADRGVKLVEMGPMMMHQNGPNSQEHGQKSGGEQRMGMMNQGGGWSGMRPHPPAGK